MVQHAADMGKVTHYHDRAYQRPAAMLERERSDDGKGYDQCQADTEYVEESAMTMIDKGITQASEQHGLASLSACGRRWCRWKTGGRRRRHTLPEHMAQRGSGWGSVVAQDAEDRAGRMKTGEESTTWA